LRTCPTQLASKVRRGWCGSPRGWRAWLPQGAGTGNLKIVFTGSRVTLLVTSWSIGTGKKFSKWIVLTMHTLTLRNFGQSKLIFVVVPRKAQ